MYLLILYKFNNLEVVPTLSNLMSNRMLPLLPSMDSELESIHSSESLDIIRDHVKCITDRALIANLARSWQTPRIRTSLLAKLYGSSILCGYFLKDVSLRYNLERNLPLCHEDDLCTT